MPDIPEMPLGRLRALCPRGPVAEKPAKDILAGLLAQTKMANSRIRRNTVSPYDGLDQLAVRSLYNKLNSRLCRLPDNVLVRIMGFLAWDDIICLRRTSRIFLRLFSCPEFRELQDTDGQAGLLGLNFQLPQMTASPWVWPKFPVDNPRLWVNLCTRLLGERYDSDKCKQFYSGFHNVYLHCNGCQVDHPTCLFSKSQMKTDRATGATRVCVAHEGHVRICRHKTIKWADVLAALPGNTLDYNFDNRHRSPQRDSGMGHYPFSAQPDLRMVCDHPSHDAVHHHEPAHEFPPTFAGRPSGTRPVCSFVVPSSRRKGMDMYKDKDKKKEPPASPPPEYERFSPASVGDAPSFIVHDTIVNGVKFKVATWSYTAHMDLSDLDANAPMAAQDFRDRVTKLRKGANNPARLLAPLDHPGILQELRCVDPDRCGCLLYPGFARRNGNGNTVKGQVCQKHEAVRTFRSRVLEMDNITVRLETCGERAVPNGRCLKIVYTRTIRLQGFAIDPSPQWPPAEFRGKRLERHLFYMRLRDAFREPTVVPYGWFQALDRRSFGLTDDPDRHQVTWCRGQRCQLNPAFLREHYVTRLEMNIPCGGLCLMARHVGGHQDGHTEERNDYFLDRSSDCHWNHTRYNIEDSPSYLQAVRKAVHSGRFVYDMEGKPKRFF